MSYFEKPILNIIVYKDISLEQGLFWPRDLIMYKYKIFSLHNRPNSEMFPKLSVVVLKHTISKRNSLLP